MKPKIDNPQSVTLFEEIFPGDTNPYGTAFGGKILALMDRAAGLAASRYAQVHFVTASMDAVEFKAPVLQGEIAEIVARVVYTSKRTCGVYIEVFASKKTSWERRPCCQGLFFMVAKGPDGESLPIPMLDPSDDQSRNLWRQAAELHQKMLQRRRAQTMDVS